MRKSRMTFFEYFKDKIMILLVHISCMLLLTGFLYATGNPLSSCGIILAGWVTILVVWLWVSFWERRKYFAEMEKIVENMDQRYLLGELMPESFRLEDRLYKEMIRRSNKSVIERVRKSEDDKKNYRDYIESWVHEIKAPITSIDLMCENHRDELTRRIRTENQKIENYVDMALYYARSDEVYKDYMINETDLQKVAEEVLGKNKFLLIQNRIHAEVNCPEKVFTDGKWIAFILNQFILNSAKYCRNTDAGIWIFTERQEWGIVLTVEDNGIGIKAEEQRRIFEKGFTGSNGRNHERSTGMGLYLCKKLCHKLGIGIRAESVEEEGTKMSLTFPVSSYLSKL